MGDILNHVSIMRDQIRGYFISTIAFDDMIGMDDRGNGCYFETIVFHNDKKIFLGRNVNCYVTLDQAIKGHKRAVRRVRNAVFNPKGRKEVSSDNNGYW